MGAGKTLGEAVDVVEVAVRLILVLLVEFVLVEAFVLELGRGQISVDDAWWGNILAMRVQRTVGYRGVSKSDYYDSRLPRRPLEQEDKQNADIP